MEDKPVTLQVNMYERSYNIRYPSRLRVQELQVEFATQCKGRKKPNSNRRFFVCIHCGKDNFSNKLRLNQHRYEEGCDAAKYSDGERALLLPYPDFKSGQGRMVEAMGYTCTGSGRAGHACGLSGDGENSLESDDGENSSESDDREDFNEDFEEEPLMRKPQGNITAGTLDYVRGPLVEPATDIFFGPAPPKTAKTTVKPRAARKKDVKAARKKHVKEVVGGTGEQKKSSQVTRRESSRSRGVVTVTREISVLPASTAAEVSRSLRPRLVKEKGNKNGGQLVIQTMSVKNIRDAGAGRSSGKPPIREHLKTVRFAAAKLNSKEGKRKARGVVDGGDRHFKVLPRDPPAKRLKVHRLEEAAEGSESTTDGAEEGVIEGGEELGGLYGSCNEHRLGLECQDDEDNMIPDPRPLSLIDIGSEEALSKVVVWDNEDNMVPEPRPLSLTDKGSEEALSKVVVWDNEDNMVPEPRPLSLTDIGSEEALSKVVVWEEINHDNEALLRYWGDGKGSPDLITYHPGLPSKFQARRKALKRLEEGNDTVVRSRAEEKLKHSTPPVRPTKPAFPALWHLWPWASAVKLPWDWACDGATEFRSRWESNIATEAFKLQLAQLVYWWTAKKYDHTLSADVRGTVSSAVDSLVTSCVEQVVYPELDTLCAYFQYSKDLAAFEANSKAYEARLEEEIEEAVKQARLGFKRANARFYEEVTWGWCPLWRILMCTESLLGLRLPELPWEHNCIESLQVRRALTHSRVEPVRPLPLVRVLRIVFWSCYGVFRQLTCPIYGLTEHLIVKLCQDDMRLKRAVSMYVLQGKYLFTGLDCECLETVGHQLLLEVARIRDGRGVDTVCSVMSWVRAVQLRAIQDLAAAQASEFDSAWCTPEYELWVNHWEHWGRTLRTREDSDIGWFCSIGNTFPPSSAGALRADVEAKVQSLALHIQEDDARNWREWVHAVGESYGTGSRDGDSQALATVVHCVSEEPRMAHASVTDRIEVIAGSVTNGTEGTVVENINSGDNTAPTTIVGNLRVDGGGDQKVPLAKEEVRITLTNGTTVTGSETAPATDNSVVWEPERNDYPCPPSRVSVPEPSLLAPPSPQQIAIEDPYDITVNMDDLGTAAQHHRRNDNNDAVHSVAVADPSGHFCKCQGPVDTELFLGLDHALEAEKTSPGSVPVLSLTEVQDGAHGVVEMAVEGNHFELRNVSKCLGIYNPIIQTPLDGVSFVSYRDTRETVSSRDNIPYADLDERLESNREMEAVNQLVELSQRQSQLSGILEDGIWDNSGLGTSGAMVLVSEHLEALTLSKAYSFLAIKKLLKKVPVIGSKSIPRKSVVFYNQFQKEQQVRFTDIQALKKPKTLLGNDIVDFVMSRVYMQYPSRHRHQIHIVSSRVSTALEVVMKNGEGVEKFAQCFMRPPPPYKLHEVKEVIVPWVSEKHWSLLILLPHTWCHLDSVQDGTHSPQDKDSEFVRLLYAGWQYLRGEEEHAVLNRWCTPVFQQPGNSECGHNTIRNVLLYLKHRPTSPRPTLEPQHGEFLIPFRHQAILTQIMALLAREIDPTVRDTRFRAPFLPEPDSEDDGGGSSILMDGKPYISSKKRQTP